MTQHTSRLGITYPSEQQQPFFEPFEQGMRDVDSLHYAHLDALNTQVYGGGNVTWKGSIGSPVNQFSFSSPIFFVSPAYGSVATWASSESPIIIPPGNFLVALLFRGSTTSYSLSQYESESGAADQTIIVTDKVPVSPAGQAQVIAYHAADGKLYVPTGLVIAGNTTSTSGLRPAGGAGSGDLSNETYVTLIASANLTNERVLTGFLGDINLTDGGPGGNAILSLPNSGVSAGSYTNANITVDARGRVTTAANGTGLAAEPYLTTALSGNLTSERVLAGAAGQIDTTDGGPNANFTLSLANTAVTPGSYIKASVTVDAKGRITNVSPAVLVDTRVTPHTTSTIAGAGGVGDGEVVVGAPAADLKFLRVTMSSPGLAQIQFFADAARTDEIYKAPFTGDYDFAADGPYVDRTSATMTSNDGTTGLETNRIYYRITNNSGSSSTFSLFMLVEVL